MIAPGAPALALVAIACSALLSSAAPATTFKGGLLTPSRAAPAFALTTQDGKGFTLSQARGKVVAISFGYTFVIPPGTGATAIATFPSRVNLTLGLEDVLSSRTTTIAPSSSRASRCPPAPSSAFPFRGQPISSSPVPFIRVAS